MTKKEMYNALLTIATENGRTDLVDGINHELELLQHKNASRSSKPSAKQLENDAKKVEVLELLGNSSNPMTIKELMEYFPNYSNQRVSRWLTDLINDNKVQRAIVKKVRYFSLI